MEKTDRKVVLEVLAAPSFNNVLVACHQTPDGDAVGSAFSLVWALRKLGKHARFYCADPVPPVFSHIADCDPGDDFVPEHFVTVDVASPELLGKCDFAERVEVAIDHHRINTVSAPYRWIDPESASCGEIVLQIVSSLGVEPDEAMAGALFTAVTTDTGCFRYSNTNENTFLAAAFLSRYAGKGQFYGIIKKIFETKSFLQLKLDAWCAENVELCCDGKCAFLRIDKSVMDEFSSAYGDWDNAVNVIRKIEGVQVSVVLKEKEKGLQKVSVRSEAGFDAAEFCRAFGGGGHRAAAGCSFESTPAEAEALLKDALKKAGL